MCLCVQGMLYSSPTNRDTDANLSLHIVLVLVWHHFSFESDHFFEIFDLRASNSACGEVSVKLKDAAAPQKLAHKQTPHNCCCTQLENML